MFIAFCGIDGSGKSTQLKATENWLRDKNVELQIVGSVSDDKLFFQSYLHLRELVKMSQDCDFSECGRILMAFELFKKSKIIKQSLEQGRAVLSHRWIYSHQAYARHESKIVNQILNNCLKPDLVFYFDIDPDSAINRIRIRAKQTEFESYEILNRARENFLRICKINENFVYVDGEQSIEAIFEIVQHEIARLMRN